MKTFFFVLPRVGVALLGLTLGLGLLAPPPAAAQIRKMSNWKLRSETNRAERQARRVSRKTQHDDPSVSSHLDMKVYNMKPNKTGHKVAKTKDGRDNYQFTRKGEPIVTAAPMLTAKRLKRKK